MTTVVAQAVVVPGGPVGGVLTIPEAVDGRGGPVGGALTTLVSEAVAVPGCPVGGDLATVWAATALAGLERLSILSS